MMLVDSHWSGLCQVNRGGGFGLEVPGEYLFEGDSLFLWLVAMEVPWVPEAFLARFLVSSLYYDSRKKPLEQGTIALVMPS